MSSLLRRVVPTTVVFLLLVVAGRSQTLEAALVAETGSGEIVDLSAPPGDTDRLFVVDRDGFIRIIQGGTTLATPFLDISIMTSGSFESGLLGLAFHPNYLSNGRFYVNYTNLTGQGNTVIAEYTVLGDPLTSNVANPASEVVLRTYTQPFANHQGGCLRFGPDGMLYAATGDGGSSNDPGNRAQDPLNPLGKMLRFDVDNPPTYIPADNPGVGDANVLDEIWAIGLRNPWRFSFDSANGDLYIGDVGQTNPTGREEVNYSPADMSGMNAGRDLNYGWRCLNGSNCSGNSCTLGCPNAAFQLPVHEYTTGQNGNAAIVGGYVYRGSLFPALQGTYFFADFQSGRIWSFRLVGGSVTEFTDRSGQLGNGIGSIAGFGQGGDGELYILDFGNGRVYHIREFCPNPVNYCTAVANTSGQPANISFIGSNSISANNLAFSLSNLPAGPEHTGIVAYSPDQAQMPLGNGNLCLGHTTLGFVVRGPSFAANGVGTAVVPFDVQNPPFEPAQAFPGETWNYQGWFRDFVGSGFNFSNGLAVTWCP